MDVGTKRIKKKLPNKREFKCASFYVFRLSPRSAQFKIERKDAKIIHFLSEKNERRMFWQLCSNDKWLMSRCDDLDTHHRRDKIRNSRAVRRHKFHAIYQRSDFSLSLRASPIQFHLQKKKKQKNIRIAFWFSFRMQRNQWISVDIVHRIVTQLNWMAICYVYVPMNPSWQKSSTNHGSLRIVFSSAKFFMMVMKPRLAKISSSNCT